MIVPRPGDDALAAAAPDADAAARLPREALAIVLAAVPLHVALAWVTDLSPDEAYYLCAARQLGLGPIVDHPPLLPWLLRLSDAVDALPLELRVRVWPVAFSLGLGLAAIALARRLGADRRGSVIAGWLGTWSLLPTAGGFVATPDGPALLACAAVLLWASVPAGGLARPEQGPGPRLLSAVSVACIAAVGALAKVVVLPVVALACAVSARPWRERAFVLAGAAAGTPLLLPSLRFQLHHAFADSAPGGWSLLGAIGAIGAFAAAQALLWSPWVLARGLRAMTRVRESAYRPAIAVCAGMTALLLISAAARAIPPEPNWWAPAALGVLAAASTTAAELAPRRRTAMLGLALAPTLVAVLHVAFQLLPLPRELDPTARLHGWSRGSEPTSAPGIGPYGVAAERCVYRGQCAEIRSYFEAMRHGESTASSRLNIFPARRLAKSIEWIATSAEDTTRKAFVIRALAPRLPPTLERWPNSSPNVSETTGRRTSIHYYFDNL